MSLLKVGHVHPPPPVSPDYYSEHTCVRLKKLGMTSLPTSLFFSLFQCGKLSLTGSVPADPPVHNLRNLRHCPCDFLFPWPPRLIASCALFRLETVVHDLLPRHSVTPTPSWILRVGCGCLLCPFHVHLVFLERQTRSIQAELSATSAAGLRHRQLTLRHGELFLHIPYDLTFFGDGPRAQLSIVKGGLIIHCFLTSCRSSLNCHTCFDRESCATYLTIVLADVMW